VTHSGSIRQRQFIKACAVVRAPAVSVACLATIPSAVRDNVAGRPIHRSRQPADPNQTRYTREHTWRDNARPPPPGDAHLSVRQVLHELGSSADVEIGGRVPSFPPCQQPLPTRTRFRTLGAWRNLLRTLAAAFLRPPQEESRPCGSHAKAPVASRRHTRSVREVIDLETPRPD